MSNTEKWELKERIDTNKDYIINIDEINNFIFDDKQWNNNLNELWNYLNWLPIFQSNNDIIKKALMWYFLSKEWLDESKTIWDKVRANQPLEKRELTLLYLQMIDIYSRTGKKYQWSFDPNKPASWELLTFIKRQYNNQSYNPQPPKSDAQKFQDNQKKDKFGLYTKESPKNTEIPQIPELDENNLNYVHNYCNRLIDWAEENFANEVANIRYNVKAKHYDISEDKLSEYARYDILLFAFEKYCEAISNNNQKLIKQAWYKNNEELQQQIEELGKLWEEISQKFPNLEEAIITLQKFWEEVENNKKKYFKSDEEVEKAWKDSEEFNQFLETKAKEYKIDEIKASFEKDPETSEEAQKYCEWINKIIEYQEEVSQKSESYWDSIKKYQKYMQWNLEISKKYQNINEYIEVQKQYSEFIKWWQNKIDFDKYEKYNQLRENSGIDKDFHNMSILWKIIMNPQYEYFPILWVKNAEAEKQAKIDAFRTNLQKNNWPAYRLLTSLSGFVNGFISSTVGVWTWLGYLILSLCWKDTADLNKRKEFYDNLLKVKQSSQQKEAVYDPDSNSINLNWHNWISTVSSQIANMLVLITGGSSIFWKWFSKIAWTTKNVAQGAKIAWVTKNVAQGAKIVWVREGIAHRAWVFTMSFITNIWQSFQEAKNKNLDWWAAFSYSMLSSIVQGSLEQLSPNEILVWWWSNITKELIKNLVKNGSKKSFMMLWKAFLKNVWMEIIEENFQEGLQLAAWNLINMYADGKRWTDFWADWSWKNFAQTAIITTLTTWITTWTSYMSQLTNMSNNSTSKLFNEVVNNGWTYTAVMEMLDKAISGQIKIPNTNIASLQQLKTAFLSVNDVWYFNWKPQKFDVSWSQATLNSTTMDKILNEKNEKNKSKKLKQLGKEISEQYEQATWEKIELTDEQLQSILYAHEQDWVLWELTTGQLKQKVEILDKTITDPNVRRFLLEAWFCGSPANMLQAAQDFYKEHSDIINNSIDVVGKSINNAYKSIKRQNREKYEIGEKVDIPRYDGSITHGAHIQSYDPRTWTYLVVRYQNWKYAEKYVSTEELDSINGNTTEISETSQSTKWYSVWEEVNIIKKDWNIGKANITEFNEIHWLYRAEWNENWKSKFYYFTKEELDHANPNHIEAETVKSQETKESINSRRKEMADVRRISDVIAIWDLHWEYIALKWNLEYAWLAKEINWHLQWTGWNKRIVFQWDILSDRWTDGLKIIKEIYQLRQQAQSQWWDINIIVGNHDDFMISYLTWRNWIHEDWINISIGDFVWWINSWQWRWILELVRDFYTWKPPRLKNGLYDFKKILKNGHENILNNMRKSPEWRIILEEICNMKPVLQIDDVLYCHTNPTQGMLQYLTNWNIQDNINMINQKYQWYLRKVLLWEWWQTISTREFNEISDLFLNTDNRDIWWIEKYVDQLRNSWINMISHWHSGGGWKWNWQYVYDNNQTDINWLKIVDADFSYWKRGREWWTHSISTVQQDWWNIITWDN